MPFSLSDQPIDANSLRETLRADRAGGYVSFEGWVRDHQDGKAVRQLEYSAYEAMALKEGSRILEDAKQRFDIEDALCVHRVGLLQIGDMAVWVGVSAAHRDAAFEACRHIIDAIKATVPIWKRETFQDGAVSWVNANS